MFSSYILKSQKCIQIVRFYTESIGSLRDFMFFEIYLTFLLYWIGRGRFRKGLGKGRVFFFQKKIVFLQFWAKTEWVSKKAVFFPRPEKNKNSLFKWVSECACKLFLGKKTRQNSKNRLFFFRFAGKKKNFFQNRVSEWALNFSGEKIKNITFDMISQL